MSEDNNENPPDLSDVEFKGEENYPSARSAQGIRQVLLFVLLIGVTYPLWGPSSEHPEFIEETSFPSGRAGLNESDPQSDQIRALTKDFTDEEKEEEEAEQLSREDALKLEAEQDSTEAESDTEETNTKELPPAPPKAPSAGPFKSALPGITRPVQFAQDAKGTIWLAHLWGLASIKDSDPNKPKVVLSKKIYDSEFNDDLKAVTSVGVAADGSTWLGFANGQIMRYLRYEWKVISSPNETIQGSVSAIHEFDKRTYFASRGLFKWDEPFKRLLSDPQFRNRRVYDFADFGDGKLYIGGRSGLWVLEGEKDDRKWRRIWKPSKKDFAVYSFIADSENAFMLATSNGLVRVSDKGVVLDRVLAGEQVTKILKDPKSGGHWIATRKNGLKYSIDDEWYVVSKDEGLGSYVPDVHIDGKNQLWIAVDTKGVFVAPLASARKWLQSNEDTSLPVAEPEVFTDACHAANGSLKGIKLSGDIAVEVLDGRGYVFIRGVQNCPSGHGHRREDGTVTLLDGWNANIYREKNRQVITIPESVPADKVSAVLLDSKNRLWLGTDGLGLYRVDSADQLKRYARKAGFQDNPVTTIVEDGKGRIWVGTTPPYDQKNQKYEHHNLHLYTDGSWYHFDPRNGLVQISTHSLAFTKERNLVVGTHGGFSIITPEGKITSYGPAQGLDPYFAKSVSPDRKGRLWIAHQYYGNGITWFDGEAFHRVDTTKGLFNDRISLIAHDRARRVWLISSNGRVGVYPLSFFTKDNYKSPLNKDRVVSKELLQ